MRRMACRLAEEIQACFPLFADQFQSANAETSQEIESSFFSIT